jgi:4-carboxymuconolactone decarboxylase
MEQSRLPGYTRRESLPEEARPWADEILKHRKYILGPVAWALPYIPETTAHIASLGDQVRKTQVLSKGQVQFASLVAVHFVGNDYLWKAHLKTAAKAGVPDEAIARLHSGAPTQGLAPEYALLIQYGREMFGASEISSSTFETARTQWGAQGMMELAAVLGYYVLMSCISKAAGVIPDPA